MKKEIFNPDCEGFSLIELMISLITISCITAAFTPVITKKLKNSNVSVALSEVTTKCDKFSSHCTLCYSGKCIACSIACLNSEYKDNDKCACFPCTNYSPNCLLCNAKTCTKCSSGYGIKNSSCEICPKGYYSDGLMECVPCEVGKYQNEQGKSTCKNCEAGKYQDEEGKDSCKIPPNGTYQDQSGQSTTIPCPEDNYCTNGVKTPCLANQGANAGSSACTTCSTRISNCAECSNLTQCTRCAAGYYLNSSKTCSSCPAGSFCNGITQAQCPAGQYSSSTASSCANCPAGKYSSTSGSTTCANCQAGKWSSAGATSCTLSCPAGYACNGAGTATQCPAGQYAPSGSSSCKSCPAGQYQNSTGQTGCIACSAKTANCTACNATTGACSACSTGYGVQNGTCVPTCDKNDSVCASLGLAFTNSTDCKCVFNDKACLAQDGAVIPLKSHGFSYNLCVKKHNTGDGPTDWIWTNIVRGTGSEYSCIPAVVESGRCNLGSLGTYYSGCARTVCWYSGAKQMCSAIGWRLPKRSEITIFGSSPYNNTLDLCSEYQASPLSRCGWGYGCYGADRNSQVHCDTSRVWDSDKLHPKLDSYTIQYFETSTWNIYAASARCVRNLE